MAKRFLLSILPLAAFVLAATAQSTTTDKSTTCSLSLADFHPQLIDWYYPPDEAQQRANLQIPSCSKITPKEALLRDSKTGQSVTLATGQSLNGWRLVETLTQPQPIAVLEYDFPHWGLIVYVSEKGVVAQASRSYLPAASASTQNTAWINTARQNMIAFRRQPLPSAAACLTGDSTSRPKPGWTTIWSTL